MGAVDWRGLCECVGLEGEGDGWVGGLDTLDAIKASFPA